MSPYEYTPRLKPAPLSCGSVGQKVGDKKVDGAGGEWGPQEEKTTTRGFKKRSTSAIQKWLALGSTAKAETPRIGTNSGVGKVEGK